MDEGEKDFLVPFLFALLFNFRLVPLLPGRELLPRKSCTYVTVALVANALFWIFHYVCVFPHTRYQVRQLLCAVHLRFKFFQESSLPAAFLAFMLRTAILSSLSIIFGTESTVDNS